MANKTTQALKISCTVSLNEPTRTVICNEVLQTALDGVEIATAKVRITHAIAAKYDDPIYTARATERIAEIKAECAKLGEIEAWHVTAGAVPEAEAEVVEIAAE